MSRDNERSERVKCCKFGKFYHFCTCYVIGCIQKLISYIFLIYFYKSLEPVL